ncbi:hypothetical protein Golax_014705 [Gossypium laxum]|uniref:RNase H type-1 domain-containing protein n=1 Tax=Gossypium laxum TaxID=34288 RepID=A0A7J8ZWX8_9ROSI|nr:hypothetical protein [Gossypium laxum]
MPTLGNLKARGLIENAIYPACNKAEETVPHLFRDCMFTKQVLQKLGITHSSTDQEQGWKQWWLKYYPELYKKRETRSGGQQTEEWLKKNFDASYQGHQNRSISGVIIRNNEGLVMASCVYPVANVRDPTMTKAWVCFQAVTFVEKLGFRDVCVEGDALTVIRKLRDRENDKSVIGNLVNEIKIEVQGSGDLSFIMLHERLIHWHMRWLQKVDSMRNLCIGWKRSQRNWNVLLKEIEEGYEREVALLVGTESRNGSVMGFRRI